jgi:hypothetical protein
LAKKTPQAAMATIQDNDNLSRAYEDLFRELAVVNEERDQLIKKLTAIEAKENMLLHAVEALKPLLDFNPSEFVGKQVPDEKKKVGISWKYPALDLINGDRSKKFSSAEIFDAIHPNPKGISEEDRRRGMINLANALTELFEEGKIQVERKPKGEGKGRYYFAI